MFTPLYQSEFEYWQELFIKHSWHGRSLDIRRAFSQILGPVFDFYKGAIFCTYTNHPSPTQIGSIKLGDRLLAQGNQWGRFAAIEDKFIIQITREGSNILPLPFEDVQAYRVGWKNERIALEISFRRNGLLAATVNTLIPISA